MVKQQPDKYHFQQALPLVSGQRWNHRNHIKRWGKITDDLTIYWHGMDGTWWNSREHFHQAFRHNTFSYLILKRRHASGSDEARSDELECLFNIFGLTCPNHPCPFKQWWNSSPTSITFNKLYHWWVVSVETTSKDLERSQMIRHRTRQGKHCYTGKPYPHDIKLSIWLMFVRVRIRLTTGGQQTFKNPIAFHIHISLTWQVHGQPWLSKCWFH